MKTGIIRRIDDLGRIVIPKEVRRALHIGEGDPLLITLTQTEKRLFFGSGIMSLAKRLNIEQ